MVPAGAAPRLPVIDPPSLCEAGPCRNYHRVVSVMDAQDPVGETGPTRRQITRACYPTAGIELELGETPVLQCSRWEPDNEQARLDSLRAAYMKSPAGKQFAAEVTSFEAAEAQPESPPPAEAVEAKKLSNQIDHPITPPGVDADLANLSSVYDELADMIIDEAIGGDA
jgi:hypothetical protein